MNIILSIVLFTIMNFASCRDFYVGMFKQNDWLVAQDHLYKQGIPYKYMYAKYGRIFKCKITYFRVADRLGFGQGPKVQIVRGGLNRRYLVLRLASAYNKPISVNIYVGCANKFKSTKAQTSTSTPDSQTKHTTEVHKADTTTTNAANATGNATVNGATTVS